MSFDLYTFFYHFIKIYNINKFTVTSYFFLSLSLSLVNCCIKKHQFYDPALDDKRSKTMYS